MGVENYTLGKGILYFDRKDVASGKYMGQRDLGNAPSFSFNIAIEKLPHYSSRGGIRSKDKEIITELNPTCSFTLDEITAENLEVLALASIEKVSQTGASVTDEAHVAHLGRRITLAFRDVSAVTVKDDSGVTTYAAGTDYLIDTTVKDDKLGRILILEGGSITEGSTLHISYTYGTLEYKVVRAFKQTQVEGYLTFISDNPAGKQLEVHMWRVSLTPSGDTSFIGDDWSTLGFQGELLKDEAGHPNSPYMDIIMGE